MKRRTKILLFLVAFIALVQVPFVYRRHRLAILRDTIAQLNATRRTTVDANYSEYVGVIHVHSLLGGHSAGQFSDIVQAAKTNDLSFVVMTEHPSREIDTADATLKGVHDGVVFINGSELVTREGKRFLIASGFSGMNLEAGEHTKSSDLLNAPPTSELLTRGLREGKLSLLAYPEQTSDLNFDNYDGIEIYNLYTNSKKVNYASLFFDCLWSYRSFADLLWARFYESPRANLERWDELTTKTNRKIVATAGNDSHANVGLRLQDAANHQIFGIQLDPYTRSFQVVRNHVLLESNQNLNAETLLAALKNGHSFIAFDLLTDARSFRFTAENDATKKTMGDEITLGENSSVRLRVVAPVACRVQLIKNGNVFKEARDVSEQEWAITERGVYRVEVYLDQLPSPPDEKLWIISNPIYVK